MLGTFAVGKTSLVSRFVHGIFSERYQTTLGVKIDTRDVQLGEHALTLLVWDLNGEDSFQRVRDSYLRGSSGLILVVDGTRADTLEPALALRRRALELVGDVPTALLANKLDLRSGWTIEQARLDELADAGLGVQHTSAATGEGVAEAFTWLAERMLEA
ncbi:MAG: GTP-binding protein [Planctomycetes bacterium]|nr:GTP-binding protein [Planctomycetota bacterium]